MNQKTIITIVTLFISILLFVALVIYPLLKEIKKDSMDLERQYLKVFKASSAETEAIEFLKFSQTHKEDFETIENIFVDAETPIGFIRFIEKIALTSNIEVKITPGIPKKQKGTPWPVMDFQLASSANYSAFLRFLEKLENGPYLLEVQNASITKDRTLIEEDVSKNVIFALLVKVFTGPLPESL